MYLLPMQVALNETLHKSTDFAVQRFQFFKVEDVAAKDIRESLILHKQVTNKN